MNKKKQAKTANRDDRHRNRPLHIPLDFETAVSGLLAIDPKKAKKPTTPKKKKPKK